MKTAKRALFIAITGLIVVATSTSVSADAAPSGARATLEKALQSVQGQKNIGPILPYTDFDAFFASLSEEDREIAGAANGAELKAFYESSSAGDEGRLDKLKVEDLVDPKQRLSPDQRTGIEANLPQIVEFAKQVSREANAKVASCIFSVIELAEQATNASGKVKCETSGKSYVADVTLVRHDDRWMIGSLKFLQDILAQVMGMDNAAKEAEKEKAKSEESTGTSSL